MSRIVVSCCSHPQAPLDDLLELYARLGYRHVEAFALWTRSSLEIDSDPLVYQRQAAALGLDFYSLHMPEVKDADSLQTTRRWLRFAAAMKMHGVYLKAASRELFAEIAPPLLGEAGGLGLAVWLEPHAKSAVAGFADVEQVLRDVPDPRLQLVLEVGHLHRAGVSWQRAWEAWGDRIGIVHLKNVQGRRWAPLESGELDLGMLVRRLRREGYAGDWVIEMQVPEAEQHLASARQWLESLESPVAAVAPEV